MVAAFALALLTVASASGSSAFKGSKHHKAARTLAVALTADPDHISFTLEGCRNDGSITLPNGDGTFICADAAYTTGNLGSGWNELDLVPFRTTVQAGNAAPGSQTYAFAVALDGIDGGKPGYDVMSEPVLNTSLSSSSCTAASAGSQSTTTGVGGIDTTVYRLWTITQAKSTTCIYDWYGRLAVDSHLWPGASLHANLLNQTFGTQGIGAKEVSIPVKNILPQSISKTMTAQRDTDHTWNVAKSASPANLNFGNVCSNTFSSTKTVGITVTWTRGAATPSGQTTIITTISATNPAARSITISVEDKIYTGSTSSGTLLDTATLGPVVLPANTTTAVGTHTFSTPDTSTTFNDVATGTYTDTVTNVEIPGHTQATKTTTVTSGTESNATATIADTESITTGKGLTFDVASPSVGSFVAPSEAGALLAYVAGDSTVGPVNWGSGTQSGSGSVTFSKTVKMDPISVLNSGDAYLTDTATLTGSNGASSSYGPLSVGITSSALTTLTINKNITNVLQGSETATFQFHVYPQGSNTSAADPTISFAAGDTSKSATVSDLPAGDYTVSEDTLTGWNPQDDQDVDLTVPDHCSNSVTFNNSPTSATASALKVTDPAVDATNSDAPYAEGWTFTLTRPDASTLNGTTDSSGDVVWDGGVSTTTALAAEGAYTIGETGQTGWTEVGAADGGGTGAVTGSATTCSFTVNYPADSGKTFKCTITNRSRGSVRVHKTLNGLPLSGSQAFAFKVLEDASASSAGTQVGSTLTTNAANGGNVTFTGLLPGVQYAVCEQLQAGFGPNFDPSFGPFNPNNDANWLCEPFSFEPADTVSTPTVQFNVDNSHATAGALTIGYWKNHADPACKKSKGKQADILGQNLAGITLGTVTFSVTGTWECQGAVQTLSKQTFSGQNRASDPLFNMAAQLLAYYLNLNQGAGTCQAAIDAAASGQALLVKYGWNGNTYSPALTSADAQTANDDAAALDSYNNNNLC